jgi:phosphate transport system substrate-binding protein
LSADVPAGRQAPQRRPEVTRKDMSMSNWILPSRAPRALHALRRPRALHRLCASLLAASLGLAVLAPHTGRAADLTLTETGSTLLHPLFAIWVADYTKTHPGIAITIAGTGSEAGITQAVAGAVRIGASDAYMSDAQVRQNPDIMNIPLAIAAQTINYNLPGLNTANLKLDGPALAGIYTGAIRGWDAPAIAALNPGVTLPHHAIIPVHRGEGSGDTFVFTQFLTFSTSSWEDDKGYGTTIDWPVVPGGLAATGNDGMVKTIQATPYSIGYVGVSFSDAIAAAELGTAALKNNAGLFVLPTKEGITAGAAALGPRTPPDERLTLAFAPGDTSYPLVSYEYAVVSKKQQDPATAAAIRRFLLWCIEPSEDKAAVLDRVHFIPLPPHTWELSQAQIQLIK